MSAGGQNVSSGIPITDELHDAFGRARTEGNVRIVKIQIEDDKLKLSATVDASGSDEADFDKLQPLLEPKAPAFFAYKLDKVLQDPSGNAWLMIAYVPSGSPVQSRMVYASSRDGLKQQLGKSFFTNDMHASGADDVTWAEFQDTLLENRAAAAPLTSKEKEKRSMASAVVDHGHTRDVAFPLSKAAHDKLVEMANGGPDFVQTSVDVDAETIELVDSGVCDIGSVASKISEEEPRFTFFRARDDLLCFIYSCPEAAKIKVKMLYSTVKANMVQAGEQAGLKINKKIEVSDQADLTEDYFTEEVLSPRSAPKKLGSDQKFSRPGRPGKGGRRLPGRK